MRYNWGSTPTDYTYTGQYSNVPDFGLMYYNARWYDSYLNHFTQPDSIIPNPGNVLDWNRYSYARYNPLRYADPSGHWVDAVIDGAFIGADIYDISQNGLNWENGLALTADVVGAVIPIATGLGLGVRAAFKAARAADKAADVVKVVNAVDNVVDTANAIENAIDVANAGDNLADALKAADNIPCSFSAETSVSTNEGAVTIAAIEIGDYVLAWNEADGTLGYYPVTAVLAHDDLALTEVIIDGEWLETTPEHPFYTKDDGWLPAGELKTGMKVRKADGSYGLVWLKWTVYRAQEMYNLTVDTAHTFFVGEGQWLVHNTCPLPNPAQGIVNGMEMAVDDALETATNFLGDGYKEVEPWRFVSDDGLRQVRMTADDLATVNNHAGGPHFNFEIKVPKIGQPGRYIHQNFHIYIWE